MGKFYVLGLSIGVGAGVGLGLAVGRSERNKMKQNLSKMLTSHSIRIADSEGNTLTEEQFLGLLNKNSG